MTDEGPREQDFCSIVVLGDMNPKIHHPTWYQLINLITEDDVQTAEDVVSTSPLSHFKTPAFTIICATNRWEIQTSKEESLDRVLRITIVVFDLLGQTPVEVFGFNFNYQRPTRISDISSFLGMRVASLELGLPVNGESSARINYLKSSGDRRTGITLHASNLGAEFIYAGINFHYEVKKLVGNKKQFDLGTLIRSRFEADRSEAVERLSRILHSVDQTSGINHAARG